MYVDGFEGLDDGDFSALEAVLGGGVVVAYAVSRRRRRAARER